MKDAETGPHESGVGAIHLLRANRPFRLLWCARGVSFLGDSLGLVTLLLYVANDTGQALAVALLLLIGDFAPALLGPFTGVFSDRFDLKRVMVACDLVQGVLVVLIALTLPPLLRDRGVALVNEPQNRPEWGIRIVRFRDPDANLIEVNSELPREQWTERLREESSRLEGT